MNKPYDYQDFLKIIYKFNNMNNNYNKNNDNYITSRFKYIGNVYGDIQLKGGEGTYYEYIVHEQFDVYSLFLN